MSWWRSVFSLEMRKILAYRSDFWVTFLGQIFIQLIVAHALWKAIFDTQGINVLQGFSLDNLVIYYLISAVGSKIIMGESMGFLSREIYEGTFSKYLLFPLSVFQYKTVTYFANSFYYCFLLIILYGLSIIVFDSDVTILNALSGLALFLVGACIFMLMAMSIELFSLWVDNVWTIVVMLRITVTLLSGGRIPLGFFPGWALNILKWTPFPYLLGLPTETFMGRTTPSEVAFGLLISAIWIVLLIVLVKMIWHRGQKRYTGVGV